MPPARRSIEHVRRAAERKLLRLSPLDAFRSVEEGAVLVDTSSEDRWRDGIVPGSVYHPLSVLHWRLDPDVPTSNEKLPLDAHVILICREGYSSVLAAALLQELGFTRAAVVGGFEAWEQAGLPVEQLVTA
jgi:rhodanese-related sulfurtransferase